MNGALVGIDLGGTNIRSGKIRGRKLEALDARRVSSGQSEEHVLGEIFESIDRVFDTDVAAVGCGVPGLVDVERGIVYSVENIPSWREVPLKATLEDRYGVEVFIDNDANAFALGEFHFGRGRECRNLVGLSIGTGLGAGIVIDRRLYSGSNCGAGEIGEIPYRENKLEHYCSGQFFRREAGEAGELVFERAQRGEDDALHLFHEFGLNIGHAVMTVLYAYDPERLVFGGSISRAYPLFEAGIRERLKSYAYQHALERLKIEVSDTENIAVLGAAALCLDARSA